MKKILIFTATEGHLSLAKAIKQILEANFKITIINLFSTKRHSLYTPFYRFFPSLFKVPYKIGEQKQIQKGVKIFAGQWLFKKIKEHIKKIQPDLIISTQLFYNPAIAKFLDYQKDPIPFLNIVANPWAIHPLELSLKVDFNLVYDKKGVKIGQKNKIPGKKLLAIGWPIRKEFYQRYSLAKIRGQLGFRKDVFTLLICGGSEGTNMILKIIPALFIVKQPLQIIVVCGTNKTLYKTASSLKKFIPHLSKINGFHKLNNLKIKIFAFSNRLPQFINLSDLVMGKAGPNLLFETVAQKKPFFAICHISGQEDANLDLIKKKKLGLVEENALKATKLLKKIIKNPKMLNQFQKPIERERNYNQKAAGNLVNLVRSLLAKTNG